MRVYYKGRRYKVNLFPIAAGLLLLLGVIVFAARGCSGDGGEDAPGSSGGSSETSSGASSEESSLPESSPESAIVVGGEPSSEGSATSSGASSGEAVPADLPAGSLSDWNLILLNPDEENKLTEDLDIEKTKFDEMWVDSRAAPAYQAMCEAAAAEGITLYLRSGYRSIATQKANFDKNVAAEMAKGNNEAEAIRLTKLYYTVPGHSEHHTGLAFDIITPEYHHDVYTLDETFANDGNYNAAYYWLTAHCAEYGFILRYPKNKEDITHINFEPWHYRYVGEEHARYITDRGLCLEEYIALLRAAGR